MNETVGGRDEGGSGARAIGDCFFVCLFFLFFLHFCQFSRNVSHKKRSTVAVQKKRIDVARTPPPSPFSSEKKSDRPISDTETTTIKATVLWWWWGGGQMIRLFFLCIVQCSNYDIDSVES